MTDHTPTGISRRSFNRLIAGSAFAAPMIGTACAVAGSYFSAKVATGFGRVVRERIFGRVAHFSVHQFAHFSTASLIAIIGFFMMFIGGVRIRYLLATVSLLAPIAAVVIAGAALAVDVP